MRKLNSVDKIYKLRQLFSVDSESQRAKKKNLPNEYKLRVLNNIQENRAAWGATKLKG